MAIAAARDQRLLGLVGLGIRSRGAVVGVERVRESARAGTLRLAVLAPDAAGNTREKLVPLLRARHIPVVHAPSAAALGAAAGRERTAAVGIIDGELARGIRALTDAAPALT